MQMNLIHETCVFGQICFLVEGNLHCKNIKLLKHSKKFKYNWIFSMVFMHFETQIIYIFTN